MRGRAPRHAPAKPTLVVCDGDLGDFDPGAAPQERRQDTALLQLHHRSGHLSAPHASSAAFVVLAHDGTASYLCAWGRPRSWSCLSGPGDCNGCHCSFLGSYPQCVDAGGRFIWLVVVGDLRLLHRPIVHGEVVSGVVGFVLHDEYLLQ